MAPRAQFSDLLISHWPNAEFLRRSLFEFRQFPLWNPSILGGAPFVADPLSGLWYPPNWLTTILPLPFAFNLLLILHLAWAGWGMFRWARADGFGVWPSLLGGLAFAGLPKLIAHVGAGHLSLVFAVSWSPWLLQKAEGKSTKEKLLASTIWAVIFLADVRWSVYAGAAMIILWLSRNRSSASLRSLLLCVLLFFALTAGQWLPMLELVQQSSRAALTVEDANIFALRPSDLLGLFLPNLGGFYELMTYTGIATLTLAVIGLFKSRDRVGRFAFIFLLAFAIWWSLGSDAGLFNLLARLPGLGLLRVPSRAWFIVGLAACWFAVRGAAVLEDGFRLAGRKWNLATVGLIAAGWILAIGGSAVAAKSLIGLISLALVLTAVLFSLRFKQAVIILTIIMMSELLWFNSSLIEARPAPQSAAAEWLSRQPGKWRVYSPSYSLPQLDAARFGLEQVDGVNPIQLAGTVAFLREATGVNASGYSETQPPFKGGDQNAVVDVATVNANAVPSAERLGELNARFVISEFDLRGAGPALSMAEGFELQTQIGSTRIYKNTHDAGRVRGGALKFWSPNRIVVTTSGPGQVVLSEVWYPGWVAQVDGKPVDVERAGLFRAVTVNEGEHEVIFEFRPFVVYLGLAVSGLAWLVVAGYFFYHQTQHKADS
ncbi:MAG: hypothetical protein HYZ49_20455 [Chloroflexi bacterium]|nr:hypothetical protein [Chloroflexota bacterium]